MCKPCGGLSHKACSWEDDIASQSLWPQTLSPRINTFGPFSAGAWSEPGTAATVTEWVAQPATRPLMARAVTAALGRAASAGAFGALFGVLRACLQARQTFCQSLPVAIVCQAVCNFRDRVPDVLHALQPVESWALLRQYCPCFMEIRLAHRVG